MIPTKADRSTTKLALSTAAFWPNIRVTVLTCSKGAASGFIAAGIVGSCDDGTAVK